MPFQALRFVHAASLLIDHQLHDVRPAADELRPTLIDATITAFERLIEACVDQDVDFLLLTGDTFCESDRSLRARVAIREGFDCLREAGIEVFVVPGPEDPQSAWQAFPGLPENVSLFIPQTDEPTAVMREGHVIATLQACSQRPGVSPQSPVQAEPTQTLRTSPLRISVMPPCRSSTLEPDCDRIETLLQHQTADYLAVSAPYPKLTTTHGDRMAHCPGPATAISRENTGLCGCTLVSVDDEAHITARHFVTSPLLRLRIEIAVAEHATWDELIATMRSEINSLEPLDPVSTVFLEWHLVGSSELLKALESTEAEEELFELFAADSTVLSDMSVSHNLQISRQSETQEETAWRSFAREESRQQQPNPFVTGLAVRLEETESIAHAVLEQVRSGSDPDSPWTSRLEEIVSRVSPRTVTTHVRRLGAVWFQPDTGNPPVSGQDSCSGDSKSMPTSAASPCNAASEKTAHIPPPHFQSQPADQREPAGDDTDSHDNDGNEYDSEEYEAA
ncbi:MAG: hypothetical protein VB858_15410 [Planctomycetaceae bacterium]